MSWIRVSKQEPCLVCNHTDWCLNGDDGESAMCMRTPSEQPYTMTSGDVAYIHKFNKRPEWRPPVHKPKPVKKYINAAAMFKYAEERTRWQEVERLAAELGVSFESLNQLGCAWFDDYNAWGFPMRDGYYSVIGIRLRCQKTGRKWAVEGSKSGIFYPNSIPQLRAYILEGPTDTAAAISCGLFAIGRPSCSSGVHEILQFIRTVRTIREVVIISDNDKPGLDGARSLQQKLKVRSCILTLPCKDMREFYKLDGDAELIDTLIHNTVWLNP